MPVSPCGAAEQIRTPFSQFSHLIVNSKMANKSTYSRFKIDVRLCAVFGKLERVSAMCKQKLLSLPKNKQNKKSVARRYIIEFGYFLCVRLCLRACCRHQFSSAFLHANLFFFRFFFCSFSLPILKLDIRQQHIFFCPSLNCKRDLMWEEGRLSNS